MQHEYPQLFMFFAITGMFWWGWVIIKGFEWIARQRAIKNGEIFIDMMGNQTDYRPYNEMEPGKQTTINLNDPVEEPCEKCKPPKKKWEKINAENDSSDDL